MRSFASPWSAAFVLVALMAGCTQAPPASPPVDQAATGAAIDSINTAYMAAVAARDSNIIVTLYADDGRLMAPNMPKAEGKDALRAAWVGFLSMPGIELTTTSNAKLISGAGEGG